MSALHLLSYAACALGFIFVLLSLASGLLYVAEVIEEHSALAKSIGKKLIYAEIALYLAMAFFDGLPLHLVVVGILAHFVYLGNFSRSWPIISLTSPTFLASCLMVLLSHFLSFRHFSHRSSSAAHHGKYTHYNAYNRHHGAYGQEPTFLDIATYFAVAVWLVPFYLFLSLSANDNVLPSSGDSAPRRPAKSSHPSKPPGLSSITASPVPSSAPPSPALSSSGRHQRQRSSMMKSALSSAFSIVPSALRPSTLSSQLPLLAPPSPNQPRSDLPRSPSPSFGFRPYDGQQQHQQSFTSSFAAAGTSPTKAFFPPPSPAGSTGLGFSSPTLSSAAAAGERGGALASPSLGSSHGGAGSTRTLNFSPSPSTSSFQNLPSAPSLARRHTEDRTYGAHSTMSGGPGVGMGERRASEAVGVGGAYGAGGAGGPGVLKRRGTEGQMRM
ncbi:hypothetical protein JCM10213_004979 [Rhodosporidiobolus nylandii]